MPGCVYEMGSEVDVSVFKLPVEKKGKHLAEVGRGPSKSKWKRKLIYKSYICLPHKRYTKETMGKKMHQKYIQMYVCICKYKNLYTEKY